MESYHVYIDEAGKLVAEFTGRKIRTRPAAFGDSTALEITAAPDVAKLGREVVERIGLRGVAKVDFKRGANGRLYLLEVNPRFTLWHHLGARAGVNVPALVYDTLVGRVRPPVERARAGVRWCKVWSDYPAARANGIPSLPWLRWALGCEAMSGIAWNDPLPLLRAAVWRWRESRRHAPPPPQAPTRSAELRLNPGGSGQ
jgi:predicted ATP-grasp superfamily ATP-dependent carboligase